MISLNVKLKGNDCIETEQKVYHHGSGGEKDVLLNFSSTRGRSFSDLLRYVFNHNI